MVRPASGCARSVARSLSLVLALCLGGCAARARFVPGEGPPEPAGVLLAGGAPDAGAASERASSAETPLVPFAAAGREVDGGIVATGERRAGVRLSPDGRRLAWLQVSADGGARVRTALLDEDGGLGPAADGLDGALAVDWATDSRTLLVSRRSSAPLTAVADGGAPGGARLAVSPGAGGAPDGAHVFRTDVDGAAAVDLTPWTGARAELLTARVEGNARGFIVAVEGAGAGPADVFRVDLRSGAARLDTRNPGDVVRWLLDAQGVVRGAVARLAGGLVQVRLRDTRRTDPRTPQGRWRALITASADARVAPLGFAADGKSLYLETSVSSDVSRLVEKGLVTGTERIVARQEGASVAGVFWSSAQRIPLAARFESPAGDGVGSAAADGGSALSDGGAAEAAQRQERPSPWRVLESSAAADFRELAAGLGTADFTLESADRADARWVLRVDAASAAAYWLWHRRPRRLVRLFPAE